MTALHPIPPDSGPQTLLPAPLTLMQQHWTPGCASGPLHRLSPLRRMVSPHPHRAPLPCPSSPSPQIYTQTLSASRPVTLSHPALPLTCSMQHLTHYSDLISNFLPPFCSGRDPPVLVSAHSRRSVNTCEGDTPRASLNHPLSEQGATWHPGTIYGVLCSWSPRPACSFTAIWHLLGARPASAAPACP